MDAITSFSGQYRFLSNFFRLQIPVVFDAIEFFTTEAAYVAAKTTDFEIRKKVSGMAPGKAKYFGEYEIFGKKLSVNPCWNDAYRIHLMEDLVVQKFSKNQDLRELLLATSNRNLIEGNTWHDNFFGSCACGNCPPEKQRPEREQNRLGIILMKIRSEL